MYSYGQIALAIAHAITGHTRTSKSTDYCPNCTLKCVINYTKSITNTSSYGSQLTRVNIAVVIDNSEAGNTLKFITGDKYTIYGQ